MEIVHNGAKVPIYNWARQLEPEAMQQALDAANLDCAFHHACVMPDGHSGYGLPIGGVVALDNAISPYMVGNDIACSMLAVRVEGWALEDIQSMDVRKLIHDGIKNQVPTGTRHNIEHRIAPEINRARALIERHQIDDSDFVENVIADQLGTLGSGNHFEEVQLSQDQGVWLMIHCGSRNVGARTCAKYHKLAVKYCEERGISLPSQRLAYFHFDSELGQAYYKSMRFCMDFSRINKEIILERSLRVMSDVVGKKFSVASSVHVFHNFARVEEHFGKHVVVHRKGATPAEVGCLGIIPGDMGSCSYIVEGLGNAMSFNSCSHGAGRAMSRAQARDTINLPMVRKRMEGIYFEDCVEIIEEAPGAYKDISEVMAAQTGENDPLVRIVHTLNPLISIKDTNPGIGKKRVKNKDRTCPKGYVFGQDFDKFGECKPSFCDESDRNACRHRMKVLARKGN